MSSCHPSTPEKVQASTIVLVGNPNVGKSVLFSRLTGRYVTVSNYPGTTVEITQGMMPDGIPLIDTPGINSFYSSSDDERVTRDLLIQQRSESAAVIQVADAKNLHRALLLTQQLADLAFPLVLAVNMVDEAETHGITIDFAELSRRLGIDVIPLVAVRGEGVSQVMEAVMRARIPHHQAIEPLIEQSIGTVSDLLPSDTPGKRGIATQLLCSESALIARYRLNGALSSVVEITAAHYGRPVKTVLTMQQMQASHTLLKGVLRHEDDPHPTFAQRLSRWTTHPLLGLPILAFVLYVVYKIVGEFGAGTVVDFAEGTVFGEWINPFATRLVEALLPVPLLQEVLVGEYGVITMALSYGLALILPIVTMFFLSFAVLEDSGYLPRLAVMLNRIFKLMGLNGKAVLPMILGLGCDTMATMSTRVLETRKERILVTLLLALGVPCSAQLGVILGMMGTMSATGILIWAGVVVVTMLIVGLLAARLLPGERSDFILELPPLRLPQPSNIVIKTLARVEWYLKEVLPLFIVGTLILFVVDKTGILTFVEQAASPLVVGALGLPTAATGAFLIGFLRRDYGAAGLFAMALAGELTPAQIVVSMIVITLFIPCIANVLMILKEYGGKVTLGVVLTVFPLAFAVGALVNAGLNLLNIAI